jgi:hypothetical protein
MSARLFIRNDDVWTLDRAFRYFFDMAVERGIPVVHAVIPGKMDRGMVRFLCRAREKTPQLLDIVQHGWMHTNHSVEAGVKYEFGASRSLKSQREDIKQGLKKMRLAFGEHLIPAFVPPYHGFDECTIGLMEELGFKIFSAGQRRARANKGFIDLAAEISFTRYEGGQKNIRPARDMISSLTKGIHCRPLSGILTHHADFSTAAFRLELKKFFDCVAALRDREQWRVLLFSDLWRK